MVEIGKEARKLKNVFSRLPFPQTSIFESNSIQVGIVWRWWSQSFELMCQAHFDYTHRHILLLFHFVRVTLPSKCHSEESTGSTATTTTMNFCVADVVPSVGLHFQFHPISVSVCLLLDCELCSTFGRETNFPISYMNSFYYG